MDLVKELDKRTDLQSCLFRRAFLLTKKPMTEFVGKFPLYNNWKSVECAGYQLMTDSKYNCYTSKWDTAEGGRVTAFLFGHCYNPVTKQHEETKVLTDLGQSFGKADFWDRQSEITGIYVMGWIDESGNVSFLTDPSGMQSGYYGVIDGNLMVTSHTQIIGDLYNLQMDEFVKELLGYKWYYRVMGPYLPGDMSAFKEVKRIVPNILFTYNVKDNTVSHERFYPLEQISEETDPVKYQKIIEEAADLLKNGAKMVAKKWDKKSISLTGGIDSNTTFAACVGQYDKFDTFSYLSAHKETIDVEAAKKIAARFKTHHTIYNIPQDSSELGDFELKKEIINHNIGYIAPLYDNEVRKRIYLESVFPYDVEVKSWVSETIRAYWYKHYGRTSMPKLSAKLFRNLYKIFITNRSLAHKLDKVFEQYINDFEYRNIPSGYLPADLHYNEVTWGSWGGINISDMKFYTEITILYNNRRFLDLLLRVPLEKRISDQHHLDMKKYLNKELFDMGIRVVNMKETATRARLLNIIFTMNSILPF